MALADTWRLTALTNNDGIGKSLSHVEFTLPAGQNGAEAGKTYTTADGATALAFAGIIDTAVYFQLDDGKIIVSHTHIDQSANGADGTVVKWFLPLACVGTANMRYAGSGTGNLNNVVSSVIPFLLPTWNYVWCRAINATASFITVNDNSFSNTNDYIHFTITYPT